MVMDVYVPRCSQKHGKGKDFYFSNDSEEGESPCMLQ